MFPTMKIVEYNSPQRKVFGVNAVDKLGEYIKKMGISGKAVIVTDPGIMATGTVERIQKALEKEGFTSVIYRNGMPEPNDIACDEAAAFARSEKGDFVIGLGGGSDMDIGKVVAELLKLPGKTADYLPHFSFPKKGAPFIAVTTTSGTGSESTMYAIVNFSKDNIKGFFSDPNLLADLAVVDPTLMLTMPPKVTAATGIDALSHAIETMLAKQENPYTDALAIKAIELLSGALPVAVYEGDNLDARVRVAYGAFMAGIAFEDPGIVEGHALAHTLGSLYHVPHGVGCAIGLPYVMEYNMGHSMEKLAQIAVALGQNTTGLSVREAAVSAILAVKQLITDVGLPLSWAQYGSREDIPRVVDMMTNCDWITAFYLWAKRKMTKEAATEFVTRSYEGRIGAGIF